MTPTKLCLNVVLDNGGDLSHIEVVFHIDNLDTFGDTEAENARDEMVKKLLHDFPAGTKVVSAEFVPIYTFDNVISDGGKPSVWRTLDYVASNVTMWLDGNGQKHPVLTPVAVVRILTDTDPVLIELNERERLRAIAANYVQDRLGSTIYTINQVMPDSMWTLLGEAKRHTGASRELKVFCVSQSQLKAFSASRKAHLANQQPKTTNPICPPSPTKFTPRTKQEEHDVQ